MMRVTIRPSSYALWHMHQQPRPHYSPSQTRTRFEAQSPSVGNFSSNHNAVDRWSAHDSPIRRRRLTCQITPFLSVVAYTQPNVQCWWVHPSRPRNLRCIWPAMMPCHLSTFRLPTKQKKRDASFRSHGWLVNLA
jgi:hypothetical protein